MLLLSDAEKRYNFVATDKYDISNEEPTSDLDFQQVRHQR
jgi:hypothetical protein